MEQVAPRLKAAVRYIKPVGMLKMPQELISGWARYGSSSLGCHDLERKRKTGYRRQSSPGVLHHPPSEKSGRRSHSAARTDVMGSGTQVGWQNLRLLSHGNGSGVFDPETMRSQFGWVNSWFATKTTHQPVPPVILTGMSSSIPTTTATVCCYKDMAIEGKDVLVTLQRMGKEIFPGEGAQGKDGSTSCVRIHGTGIGIG